MRTKVISMPSRHDRRVVFEQYNSPEVNAHYFPAVDGAKTSISDIHNQGMILNKDWRDPFLDRRLTKGEVGCMLSHLSLWDECAKSDDVYLIMEDDFLIDKNVYDEKKIIEAAEKYGCVYLAFQEMDDIRPESAGEGLVFVSYPYWCCAYAITPRIAKILSIQSRLYDLMPSDEIMPLVGKNLSSRGLPWVGFEPQMGAPRPKEEAWSNIDPHTDLDYFVYGDVHFLTVATDKNKAYRLTKSCDIHGININLLGEGQSWLGGDMSSPGGAHKIKLLREYLELLPENDIVVFSDGYDSFIVNRENMKDEIVGRYLGFGSDIVFSGEKTCWPDRSLASQYDTKGDYPYLNSGGFIGSVKGIKLLIDGMGEYSESDDDQLLYTQAYLSKEHDIKIDVEGYIFQTSCEAVSVGGGSIYNNNCSPLIFHGNGGDDEKVQMHKYFTSIYPDVKEPIGVNTYSIVGPEMLVTTLLTPEQCAELIDLSEQHGGWGSLSYDKFPAQEIRLSLVSQKYYDIVSDAFMGRIKDICEEYWHPMEMIGIRDIFVMKYTEGGQTSLGLHTDASLVTGSVKLNEDYEGAELVFPRQNFSNINVPTGDVILFPGEVTHGHQCNELVRGTKYSLTIWTQRFKGDST